MPLLSICIPVYNAEKYLDECIEPLIKMGEDIEIILSDDGSKDSSLYICSEYAKKYPNIVVVSGKNGGPSAARNRGIEKINGEYTIFCDADDWLIPLTYRYVKEAIEKYDPDFIQFGLYSVWGESRKEEPLYCLETKLMSEEEYKDLYSLVLGYKDKRNLAFPSFGLVTCKVFKTSIIRDLRFNPEIVGEDTIYALKAMEKIKKPVFLARHLYNYRITENSYSRKVFPGYLDMAEKMMLELKDIAEANPTPDKKLVEGFYLRCYDFLNWSISNEGFYTLSTYTDKINLLKRICTKEIFYTALKNINYSLLSTKHRIFARILRLRLWFLAVFILEVK